MSTGEIPYLTIREAANLIRRKKLSPVELTRAVLGRIEQIEPKVHAFVTLFAEEALAESKAAEREISKREYRGLMHGIPVAIKDTHYTRGIRTTSGSPLLKDFIPSTDCTIVQRLKVGGAILIGKTTLPEFSFGGFTPGTNNPWDLQRTPGGSSGGSAVALAAGLALGATGGDTAGSIRGPANYCGVVGLKPTYGRVSRYGVTGISWTLDHVGPMTRTVEDNAIMLRALAGHDANDRSSAELPIPEYAKSLGRSVKGWNIAIPAPHMFEGVHEDITDAIQEAVRVFKNLGVKVRTIDIPFIKVGEAAHRVIRIAEASSYHEMFIKSRPEDYGPSDVRRDVEAGSFITAAQYLKAQRVREAISREMYKLLEPVDLLLAPGKSELAGEPQRGVCDFIRLFNLTGIPALAVPCGFSRNPAGLPIGFQLAAKPFEEQKTFTVGHAYQCITEWHKKRPPI